MPWNGLSEVTRRVIWKDHSNDPHDGLHAFLAPSNGAWEGYDDKKTIDRLVGVKAKDAGTIIHEFACKRIWKRMPLNEHDMDSMIFYMVDHWIPHYVVESMDIKIVFETVRKYVNDALYFDLSPEREVYYSEDAFGTADTIGFNDILRIHDLKTGVVPASFKQLEKYAALFCLDYEVEPEEFETELRLYQNNDILIERPESSVIRHYMDLYVSRDRLVYEFKRSFA